MRADHLLIRVRPRSKPILTLACLGGIALIPAPTGAQPLSADRVLVNGHILTVGARDSIAQAVAIRAGRIVAVGTNAQIEALADARSERIDLHGLTVTPGLIDAHIHLAEGGLDALYLLDLSYPAVTSIEEVVAKVRTRAAEEEPGAWVRGRGWDEGKLTENRYIYASDLDAAAPDRPVWLSQTMGHYGVANSAALARAGITRDTPDPPGGVIDRSADGTPTGVLKETAQALVTGLIPEPTPAQRRAAIEQLAQALNAEGMTAAKDPRIGLESWDAYQQVLAEGKLSVRVFVSWGSPDTLDGARDLAARIAPFSKPYLTTGDDHSISGGVKIFADGSGGARTAWMYKDWNKNYSASDGGNRGYPALDPELLQHDTPVPRRWAASRGARDRRSRDRLGGRLLRARLATNACARASPLYHPRQPADRARARDDGRVAAQIRRRLPRGLRYLHVVDRRYLCGQLWSRARAPLDSAA